MRVVIFLICLCFFLRGNIYVHAATHHHCMGYSPALAMDKVQLAKINNPTTIHAVLKHAGHGEEKGDIISLDVEDEDMNEFFARKFKSLNQCYLTRPYTFIPDYTFCGANGRLPSGPRLSYKYIIQRTLRI